MQNWVDQLLPTMTTIVIQTPTDQYGFQTSNREQKFHILLKKFKYI